ncbi:hypothetical protein AB0957_22005 [Streptomyces zhihengii]|uniref:hypothetical protein n=1 Tax=Streptomyces zhihengii TaxID=1818004 RepID=UPI0034560820
MTGPPGTDDRHDDTDHADVLRKAARAEKLGWAAIAAVAGGALLLAAATIAFGVLVFGVLTASRG